MPRRADAAGIAASPRGFGPGEARGTRLAKTHGVNFAPIHKQLAAESVAPNLEDYARTCAAFTWSGARGELADGPGDAWSPEQLMLGAVSACFVPTFRPIARASRIEFASIAVDAVRTVDRRVTRFTENVLRPRLALPAGVEPGRVRGALDGAHPDCLVSASLATTVRVEPEMAG